jgi:hypothetical protein
MQINIYENECTQRYNWFYYLSYYELYSRVCVLCPELSQLIFGHTHTLSLSLSLYIFESCAFVTAVAEEIFRKICQYAYMLVRLMENGSHIVQHRMLE